MTGQTLTVIISIVRSNSIGQDNTSLLIPHSTPRFQSFDAIKFIVCFLSSPGQVPLVI